MSWKDRLTDASFRGVQFKVETGGKSGGRRVAPHSFPKKDVGYAEDMGRRMKRFRVSGYVIGDDYDKTRDALEAALDKEGAGQLKLPTSPAVSVLCDHWDSIETRTRGRVCEFEMIFIEAGESPSNEEEPDTKADVRDKASEASDATKQSVKQSALSKGDWPIGWKERAA
jgi:prophage DNA circulation protein